MSDRQEILRDLYRYSAVLGTDDKLAELGLNRGAQRHVP